MISKKFNSESFFFETMTQLRAAAGYGCLGIAGMVGMIGILGAVPIAGNVAGYLLEQITGEPFIVLSGNKGSMVAALAFPLVFLSYAAGVAGMTAFTLAYLKLTGSSSSDGTPLYCHPNRAASLHP